MQHISIYCKQLFQEYMSQFYVDGEIDHINCTEFDDEYINHEFYDYN